MPHARPLTGDLAAALGARLPSGWVKLAVAALVAVPVIASMVADPPGATVQQIESTRYLLTGSVEAVMFAVLAVVWFAPSTALVLGAAGCLVIARIPESAVGRPGLWTASGAALAVLALVDLVLAVRRRALVHALLVDDTPVASVPALHPVAAALITRGGALRTACAVLAALVGLGGLVLLWHDSRSAAAFREVAQEATGTVVTVADDDLSARVDIGGRTLRVPLPSTYRSVGDTVHLQYDPVSGRAEDLADPFDATLATIPAVGGLLAAGVLLVQVRRRRARARDLLSRPQPAVIARGRWAPRRSGVLLTPWDDVTWPLATAPALRLVRDDDPDWQTTEAATDRLGEDDGYDEDDDDLGLSALSDAELLAHARRLGAAPVVPTLASWRPEAWAATELVVLGLDGGPGPVVLLHGAKVWESRAVLWPVWRLPRRPRISGRLPAAAEERGSAWAAFERRRDGVLRELGRGTGAWMPWLLLPLVALASHAAAVGLGADWREFLWVVPLVSVACTLSFWGRPHLVLGRTALRVTGPLLDLDVAWRRVTGAVADTDALVVRYDDGTRGGEAVAVPVGADGPRLTRDRATPAEVVARVLLLRGTGAALLASGGRTGHGGEGGPPGLRRRPSVPLLVGLCWTVAWVVPLIVG